MLALGLTEALLKCWRLDTALLGPLLYYQEADLPLHRLSQDAALHYELRPGARIVCERGRFSINSLGWRDRQRSAAKPKGVFRIVCLGGSNTYGALVSDDETYPAQLETLLNAGGRGRFEVWNAGGCAYVLSQNVEQAETILARYAPDLLIFQLGNWGRRTFLYGQPFQGFFDQEPGLYAENLEFLPLRRSRLQAVLLRNWAFYRTLVIGANRALALTRRRSGPSPEGDALSEDLFSRFCARHRSHVPIVALLSPGLGRPIPVRVPVPMIDLADGLPQRHDPAYDRLHPPAYVYRYYARRIESALLAARLLPRFHGPASSNVIDSAGHEEGLDPLLHGRSGRARRASQERVRAQLIFRGA